MRASALAATLAAILTVGTGCRQPLHVSTLQLGRSLNADRTVAVHTTRFTPDDTVYASVLTDRTGASTIVARWSYAGRLVSQTEKRVSYKGQAATEFHFESAGGFPIGDYRVEVIVDGQTVASRDFRVQP
jgi:hypothetical protein